MEPADAPQERDDDKRERRSAQVLKRSVVEQEREQLAAALDWARDDPAFERIAARIVAARRRFVLGAAKSFTFASLLALELSGGLANVTLLDGTIVRPLDVLSDVRSSDVLVVFSLARYRKYSIEIAELFQAAGGTLVVVTDAPDAPLVALADECLVIDTARAAAGGSPASVALVVHILSALTTASAKGAGRRLRERDRLASRLGLYTEG